MKMPSLPPAHPEAWTLITGASSGIGEGFARALGAQGHRLILVARRRERLEALARELQPRAAGVEIVDRDLSGPLAAAELAELCAARGWRIGLLINNAGLGFQKPFLEHSDAEIRSILGVNVELLTQLTRALAPAMIAQGGGVVLNVGSVIAFFSSPGFAVYAASKAWVLSLSEALDEELRGQGVRVLCLCPGPVQTEFVAKAGLPPRIIGTQNVEQVVAVGLRQIAQKRPVVLTSALMRAMVIATRWMPRQWRVRLNRWSIEAGSQ